MSTIDQLHRAACDEGRDTYIDPASGYQVLTSKALLKQGRCCGNSCRHCPYGRFNVPGGKNPEMPMAKPVLMNWSSKQNQQGVNVLFWSGGKDSFLTLMHLINENQNVVLLTSFGAHTNRVSIQDVHIKDIARQAESFKLPLCLVPLYPNSDYKKSIEDALDMICEQTGLPIKRLVFGDLHLKDIRQWRVDTWSNYEVYTPLFDVPYDELLPKLWAFVEKMGLSITLSTEVKIGEEILPVGTRFSQELVDHLVAGGIDAMLENGEGHTLVLPKAL